MCFHSKMKWKSRGAFNIYFRSYISTLCLFEPSLVESSSTHSRVLVQGVGPGNNSSSSRSAQLSIKSHGPNKICLVWELTNWRIFTSTFLLAISLSLTKSFFFFSTAWIWQFFDRPIGGWHKKRRRTPECKNRYFSWMCWFSLFSYTAKSGSILQTHSQNWAEPIQLFRLKTCSVQTNSALSPDEKKVNIIPRTDF